MIIWQENRKTALKSPISQSFHKGFEEIGISVYDGINWWNNRRKQLKAGKKYVGKYVKNNSTYCDDDRPCRAYAVSRLWVDASDW